MEQVNAWVLQNPLWVDGPLRIWLAGLLLLMLALAIRHGRREARDIILRHPVWLAGSLIPVVAWTIYGYTVRSGTGL